MILLANSKTKLILSQSSQYSERKNRIRQQYLNGVLPFNPLSGFFLKLERIFGFF
jgi:hypothetical protein